MENAVADLAARLGIADIELRRSARRTRTVSAFRENGVVVISAPIRISQDELLNLTEQLLARLVSGAQGRFVTDDELMARAEQLIRTWLPTGFPRPTSVRWTNQQQRVWGTCTNVDASIRLSARLKPMPEFVIDYVLLHELAHLQFADHGSEFEALLENFPDRDKARGFLDGVTFQSQQGSSTYLSATQMELFD